MKSTVVHGPNRTIRIKKLKGLFLLGPVYPYCDRATCVVGVGRRARIEHITHWTEKGGIFLLRHPPSPSPPSHYSFLLFTFAARYRLLKHGQRITQHTKKNRKVLSYVKFLIARFRFWYPRLGKVKSGLSKVFIG